jgi:mRNA interferase YafQ
MEKRHRDVDAINEIIGLLICGEPLPAHCRPHGLSGNYEGYTDCHVEGDLVLLYTLNADEDKIVFHRLGTHSDLF